MGKKNLKSPDLFINRELSWLAFNDRVLQEGCSEMVPLGERLKFLSIVSSNLDEFFMIRVAGLKQQKAAGVRRKDPSGLTPSQQLFFVSGKVNEMVTRQTAAIAQVFEELKSYDFHLVRRGDWALHQRQFLAGFFAKEMLPVLTPLAVQDLDPCPLLPGLQLFVAMLVSTSRTNPSQQKLVVVPVPGSLPRFVNIPSEKGVYVTAIEEIILDNARAMFGGCRIGKEAVFRLTRDADVAIQEDEAADLLSLVRDAVHARRHRGVVRLEISARPDPRIRQWLRSTLQLLHHDIYEIEGLLDARALMQLIDIPPVQDLRAGDWLPQEPADLIGAEDLWPAIQAHDVMLFHPYERFDPVVEMVQNAADDPAVLAIKQTLYRTSGDSPVVRALARAAENGKEVTVLVELRARFDESRNVNWARQLEDAGCHVIYGIAGFKTHAKALLVIRREAGRLRRYAHLSTGNYNDRTARLYSDIGLMTCEDELVSDVAAFFNLLTGLSEAVQWQQLVIAPTDLRTRLKDLIEREIQVSTPDRPGLIMAKINSLEDRDMCRALYEASHAGVDVMLNVRGICCLRPGLKGFSDRICVRSIVDRYLEHARILYFANGGHEEVYLSSADWMRRNLDRRLELLFPVRDARIRRRLVGILKVFFQDNVKAWELLRDGRYRRVARKGRAVRAQKIFYEDAVAAVRSAEPGAHRFRPLTRPK
ncbi:MAG TPA: polyphosphate kinase 1 [Sedimentisphaerales bacterium]|nr:polyphosphate kinase 1 [Sedimentisphaerales bacterium]HRS11618.1 polyphosphate kinase 1 [Sedimentisphaerales bacterium]HRV48281.1 polyphosphate kinase 1 [Sedimentisphaerales bacterium]